MKTDKVGAREVVVIEVKETELKEEKRGKERKSDNLAKEKEVRERGWEAEKTRA